MAEKKLFSAERWRVDSGTIFSQCNNCKHFRCLDEETLSCDAFEHIPNDIISNYVIHDHPIEGDHGIFFEPVDPNVPKVKQRKKVMPYD